MTDTQAKNDTISVDTPIDDESLAGVIKDGGHATLSVTRCIIARLRAAEAEVATLQEGITKVNNSGVAWRRRAETAEAKIDRMMKVANELIENRRHYKPGCGYAAESIIEAAGATQ